MKNNTLKTALSKFTIDTDLEIINPEMVRGGTNNCTTKICGVKATCNTRIRTPIPSFPIEIPTGL